MFEFLITFGIEASKQTMLIELVKGIGCTVGGFIVAGYGRASLDRVGKALNKVKKA
jgi:hypothetical protein